MNDAMTLAPAARLRWVKAAAAGVLVLGGASGLLLNRTRADLRLKTLREDPILTAPADAAPVPAEPVVAASTGNGRVLFSLRSVQTDVPPDPFQPVAMQQPIQRSPLAAQSLQVEAQQPALRSAPAAKPAPAEPAAPAAPEVKPEALALTGIVQGDPPVAVVQFQGQSLFLKIGDQVADSWRLVEVKERSAIFQMGARRVEVPIKGGSSE